MKITKADLKQIIKEEIEKVQVEEGFGNTLKGLGVAAGIATAGVGAGKAITKGSYSELAGKDASRLSKTAKEAIYNKINQGAGGDYNDPHTKVVFDSALPSLFDNGKLKLQDDGNDVKVILDDKTLVAIMHKLGNGKVKTSIP
jgi:hypothetical protein